MSKTTALGFKPPPPPISPPYLYRGICVAECKEKVYDYANGYVVCAENGEVLDVIFYEGSEERAYTPEERLKRLHTGKASAEHELGSVIGAAEARYLVSKEKASRGVLTLVEVHRRASSRSATRSAKRVQHVLSGLCHRLGIPLSRVLRNVNIPRILHLLRGSDTRCLAAAAVYYAAKAEGIAVSLEQAAGASGCDVERAYKVYRKIVEELGVRISRDKLVMAHVNKIVSALSLPGYVAARASDILGRLRWSLPSSKESVVAAGLVYLAAELEGLAVSSEKVAVVAGVSPPSVREAARKLEKALKALAVSSN